MKLLLINVSVIMILLFIGCQEKNLSAQTSEKINDQTKLIDVINRLEFASFGHLLIFQGVATLSDNDTILLLLGKLCLSTSTICLGWASLPNSTNIPILVITFGSESNDKADKIFSSGGSE